MSVNEMDYLVQALHKAGLRPELIEQVSYAVDYEAAVSALEARLRGNYQFQEVIMDALSTTMDFYDADSVLVVSLDLDMMIATPEFELHREGFMPVCGTNPMFLNEYPEILEAVRQVANEICPYTVISSVLAGKSKSYIRLNQLGIQSLMAVPYSKRNTGFVAVVNPRKYQSQTSLLQVLSYVAVSEINEMNLMNQQKSTFFDDGTLAPNDVYVKLLDGFELHTKEGVVTEKELRSNQSVLFLTHLLTKKGAPISDETLLAMLWDRPDELDIPERTLKNLSYSTKKKVIHLFPANDFLEIGKSCYSISRKYNIITDLDWFGYQLRDIQGTPNLQSRLTQYLNLLNDFRGTVLPMQEHRSLKAIDDLYMRKQEEAQLECLALMYDLERYSEMHDFINRMNLRQELKEPFLYWEIKADIGLKRLDLARRLMRENIGRLTLEHKEELSNLLGEM